MESVIADPTSLQTSRARARPSGIRAYISPSRLNLWLKCPLAFQFRYVADIKTSTTPALFLGKTVHAALEFFYKSLQSGTVATAEEVGRYLVDAWVQLSSYAYLYRHVAHRDETALEIRNLIKTKSPKVEYHRWPAREERHFRRLFAIFRAYLDNLESGRFIFRPSWACSSCDYCGNHCRTWCD